MRINPGLTTRLVTLLALLAVGVVLLDTSLTRWAFQQRFLSYVNKQDQATLEVLGQHLASMHDEAGSWAFLDEHRSLAHALRSHARSRYREGDTPRVLPGEWRQLRDDPEALRLFGRNMRVLLPRLYLMDVSGEVLAGPENRLPGKDASLRQAIAVDDVVVGYLVAAPLAALTDEMDQQFQRDHMRTLWSIALLAAAIAVLIGWALARYLLAPVRAIAAGARSLATGDYSARIASGRSDELGDLARDFNTLAGSLEASMAAQRRWLADTAHELRTPLAVLQGEIEAIQDGVRPLDEQALHSLEQEVIRLSQLVNDLHQLAMADAGALAYQFEWLDPLEWVQEASERFRPRLEQRGLTLELQTLPVRSRLYGDQQRLGQLLGNLLENSVRYTAAPGTVRLTARPASSESLLEVTVEDSAPGVSASSLPSLFDRFVRGEPSRSRDSGGSGLGLAIARRIAEAHGGSLTASTSPLGGLRLELQLPLGTAPPLVSKVKDQERNHVGTHTADRG